MVRNLVNRRVIEHNWIEWSKSMNYIVLELMLSWIIWFILEETYTKKHV